VSIRFPDTGELVHCNDYACILGDDSTRPWIGQAKKFVRKGRNVVITVQWMYKPKDLSDRDPQVIRGPRDLVATDHQDEVDQRSLMGVAKVLENCTDCLNSQDWCWREERTEMGER
jgi:hypothetical protein